MRHRDELLGINSYMAHLGKCVEIARQRGHRVLGLIYDQALSGGFIPNAMMADLCAALPDAEIRVMGLPAMARITRIPEERLRALSEASPVFAPGAINYVRMGAIDALWDGDACRAHLLEIAASRRRDRPAQRARFRTGRPRAGAAGGAASRRKCLTQPGGRGGCAATTSFGRCRNGTHLRSGR